MLRAWFVRHRHCLEQTKTFVFGFVFVLAHEQRTALLQIISRKKAAANSNHSMILICMKFAAYFSHIMI